MKEKIYPECEKLTNYKDTIWAIEEFLEYLDHEGLFICSVVNEGYLPANTRHIVHKSLGIDDSKLEIERREILEDIRKNS